MGNPLAADKTWSFATAASTPDPSTHELRVSAKTDRSGAAALEGIIVSGNIYVFTSPDTGVSQVAFWLDDPNMSGPQEGEEDGPVRLQRGAPCPPPTPSTPQ